MKLQYILFFSVIFFAVNSCKQDNPASPEVPPRDSTTINFVINELGMRNLRSGEFYFMWLKVAADTAWIAAKPLSIIYTSLQDTAIMVGSLKNIITIDSIYDVLVTIEQTLSPQRPGLPLLGAHNFHFDPIKNVLTAALDYSRFFDDYSALQGSLVFTSKSSDSLAYTHEFYLMNFAGGNQTASLIPLYMPPSGWKYGLWAEDTNFTPHEYFFYGLFSNSVGHDSDSTNDSYPFPGGWKPQQMNMPGGSIVVTLEPQFYGDSLKLKGPSPFTLLNFNRVRFIEKNKNYPMTNVSAYGLPSGTVTFHRN